MFKFDTLVLITEPFEFFIAALPLSHYPVTRMTSAVDATSAEGSSELRLPFAIHILYQLLGGGGWIVAHTGSGAQ